MSDDDPVLLERRDTVSLVTLNRPEAMNAITVAMRRIIAEVVRAADDDPDTRSIVIQGAGDRAFCAGADIREFAAAESLVDIRRMREPPGWNDVIAATRKPTVAAIHGYCLGGGLELALACDVRISSDDAQLGLPEVRIGIIPGAGGTQRLPRVVGTGHALRLILTGDRIAADEALRIGLVADVVPRGELLDRAFLWAQRVTVGGPIAIAYAKEAIRRGMELPIGDGLRLESELATLLTNTKDRLEGAAAFKERRPPAFTGE